MCIYIYVYIGADHNAARLARALAVWVVSHRSNLRVKGGGGERGRERERDKRLTSTKRLDVEG